MDDLKFKPIPPPEKVLYADEMYHGGVEALHLLAKAQIAAGLIARGMYNPTETKGLVTTVNRIMAELAASGDTHG